MNDDDCTKKLFRHAILATCSPETTGQLRLLLTDLSEKTFEDYQDFPPDRTVPSEWFISTATAD
jgi:hypothetical protein